MSINIGSDCFLALPPFQQEAAIYQALVNISAAGVRMSATNTRPNNTTAYGAGAIVGTGFTFIGARVGQSLQLSNVVVTYGEAAVPAGMTTFRVHLYRTVQVVTDGGTFNIGSSIPTIQSQYLGYVDTGTATDFGSTVVAQVDGLSKVITPVISSANIYAVLTTSVGFTPAANTVIGISIEGKYV